MSNRVTKRTYQVEGMTCSGCEARIDRVVSRLDGVLAVESNYRDRSMVVEYDSSILTQDQLEAALVREGYHLRQPQVVQSKQVNELSTIQFLLIAILFIATFIIVKNTIGFNLLPEMKPSMGFAVLFTVGLLTSLHCVAMCGGISISQCVAASASSKPGVSGFKTSLLYNSGRIAAYTIIGGLAGALGSAISFSGWARGSVAIASGLFMMVMGINLLGVFPSISRITPRLPGSLRKLSGRVGKEKSPLVVGLINGLMPCGPLQAMQLYALGTGSLLTGAASMFFFSLGTTPLMLGLGAITSMLGNRFTGGMLKVSAVMVLALGFIMIDRGFTLSGINFI